MFTGFPEAALDFYDDLEVDNSRTFWTAHSDVYETCVRGPMRELAAGLGDTFGDVKIFRPHRDVRFAKDKSPYKTYQDMFAAAGPALGWYFRVAAPGVLAGAGFYAASPQSLAALRQVVAGPRGTELEAILAPLTAAGWLVQGDTVATVPRGYSAEHPRIDLLRHKSLSVAHMYGFEPVIHTAELLDHVRRDWELSRPLVEWLAEVL